MSYVQLNYFALSKTKIIESFLSAQFNISDYEIRTRRDSKGKWSGVIDYMKTGKICKTKKGFEGAISELICSEMITSKNHCGFEWVYIVLSDIIIYLFFDEINFLWNKAASKFENLTIMGDFNINVNWILEVLALDKLCNLFRMTNLAEETTSCAFNHRSTIDLILTNRPNSSQKTCKLRLA